MGYCATPGRQMAQFGSVMGIHLMMASVLLAYSGQRGGFSPMKGGSSWATFVGPMSSPKSRQREP